MKRIAIIDCGFVRDTQVFTAPPATIDTDPNWEDSYRDVKCPCQYIGVFKGSDEDEIRRKAAEFEGVHPDVVTLVDIDAVKFPEDDGCERSFTLQTENLF